MRPANWALVLAGMSCVLAVPVVRAADPLAAARLQIEGNSLTILASDVEQTVNSGEQARVRTCYGAAGAACGDVPAGDPKIAGLSVLAELRGPELPEPIPLQNVPGGTFLLPSFQRDGDYVLDNIRLVNSASGLIVGRSEPPRTVLHVRQILLASATVTTLTLADLQARGIHLAEENYQAFNFAVGFAFAGGTITIDFPILYDGIGAATPLEPPKVHLDGLPDAAVPIAERWQPPSIVPFVFAPDLCDPVTDERCREQDFENQALEFPLFGAIVIPGTVSFLNQFFDTRLIVANGAPTGSDAMLDELAASLRLPSGSVMRLVSTEPPVAPGQQVPLVAAGGARVVAPGGEATASWTVEGLKAGTHTLQWEINGELQRPGRTPLPLASKAQGAVEVVDARFNLTFSHPDVVREGEAYTLFLTVTNLSRATQNAITVTLKAAEITGAHKAVATDSFERLIETLALGQATTVEFELVSDTTGKCFATTYQSDSPAIEGTIRLRTGVGELGIPLSPVTLVLPRFTERLGRPYLANDDLLRANVRLLGLAFSLATAPAGMAPAGLPALTTPVVERRARDLAEAGRRTFLHDGLLESLAVLALDQLGNRHPLGGFDELRRRTDKGLAVASAMAALFRQEQEARGLDGVALLDHFAATTSYGSPYVAAVVTPTGVDPAPVLEIRKISASETGYLAYPSDAPGALRTIPFGEIYALQEHAAGGGPVPFALIGHVEPDELFHVYLHNQGDLPNAGRLVIVVPGSDLTTFRRLDFGAVEVPPHSVVGVVVGASIPDPSAGGYRLFWPASGLPVEDAASPVARTVGLPPFRLVGAVQDFHVSANEVHGNAVAYLFNRPPQASVGESASAFSVHSTFNGLDVHGVRVTRTAEKRGRAAFLQDDGRVLMVRYSGPISPLLDVVGAPLVAHEHTVDTVAIQDRLGNSLSPVVPPIELEIAPLHVGGLVTGRVLRGTGGPAANARVDLLRVRRVASGLSDNSRVEVVEEVTTDDDGQYYLDFIEEPHWNRAVESQFILRATVPAGGDPVTEPAAVGEVTSVIRQQNRLTYMNIALLGRGTVSGRLVYATSGIPVAGGEVTAASTLFNEMKTTTVDSGGAFIFPGLPVGPVTLTGRDADRNAVYATVGIDRPGATVNVVLELPRASSPVGAGTVVGTVVRQRFGGAEGEEAGLTGATVAVFAAGNPIGQQETDASGRFRFDRVPAGQVSVQAADWRISRTAVFSDLLLAAGETKVVKLSLCESTPRAVVGSVYFHDPLSNDLVPVASAPAFIPGPGVFAYTGPDGTYRIDGVPVQGVTDAHYVVRAIDYARQLQGEVALPPVLDGSPGEIVAPMIVLEPMSGGVDGIVLDPLARPFGGAQVVLFPYDSKVSDGAGRFSFNNIPIGPIDINGSTRLIAHVGDGLQAGRVGYFGDAATRIVFGGHRPFVTVNMRGSGIVKLRTSSATATGIKSLIYYRPTGYHEGAKRIIPRPEYVDTETDEDGNLQLELPVGPFEIVAYNPFHGQRTISGEIEYPGQIRVEDVTFADAGTLAVTVLDVDGISPAPAVSVTLATATLSPQVLRTDPQGHCTFHLVPPGSFVVTAAGSVGGVERVGASLGAITAGGRTLDLSIRMKAQGSAAGRVMEQQGASLVPVPYAQVFVNENAYPNRRVPGEGSFVFADAGGRYQVEHLNAGAVTIVARDPSQVTRSGSVQGAISADWQVAEMPDVVLSTSVGSLAVTVRDPGTGAAVPDCQVTLDDQEATVTDVTGVAQFEALPLGTHSVYAFHAPTGRGGRVGNQQLTTPGQHLEATLYLDERGEVQGVLYDDPGHNATVSGATVELRGSTSIGELHALATTEGTEREPGRFHFGGIPEGSFALRAAAPSSPRRAGTDVTLTALSPIADVALVLEAAGDVHVRVFERLLAGVAELDPGETRLSVRLVQDGYDYTQIEPVVPPPGHVFRFPEALLARSATLTVQESAGELRTGTLDLPDLLGVGPAGGSGSAADPYHVVLGAKGVVRVTVRDGQGGLVPRAVVTLYSTGGMTASAPTGADSDTLGVAAFLAVPAGSLTVSAALPPSNYGGIQHGTLTADDEIVELNVAFAATVVVRGVVYSPAPDDAIVGDPTLLPPQAGAAVEITDSGGRRQSAVTGSDGSYRFVAVLPGVCTVRAWQPGGDGRGQVTATVLGPDGNENVLPPLVLDGSPPRILSIAPSPGIERVSRTATVEVVFSEPLDADVLPRNGAGAPIFELRSAGGQTPRGSWTAELDATTGRQRVRFTPSEPYDNFTVYGLTIDAGSNGVRDRVDRLLAEFGSVGSNFKTADTVGPEVIGTEPALARPVPPDAALRIDFNEAVTVSDEALDGDGVGDAAELYWGREIAGGGLQWQLCPASLALARNGFSLSVQPLAGIDLTGDTLRRRIHVARVKDAFDNVIVERDLDFRIRDHNAPAIDVPPPPTAPDGVLTPGLQYVVTPIFGPGSIDFVTETPPAGDIDRVEYFLVDPVADPGAVPGFVSRAFPFAWAFVPAYTGNGIDPQPFPLWIRAVDTSENVGNVVSLGLVVVKNEPPVIGSLSVAALSPVATSFYAGSAIRAAVNGVGDPDGARVTLSAELWQDGGASALATRPGVPLQRPDSGSWADLPTPAFDFTLPLTLSEGTRLFVRAKAIDMHGATVGADSPAFAVADDDLPPTVDGLVARREWPAPAGATPPEFVIADRLYLEFSARDGETALSAVTLSVDRTDIFPSPLVATRVPGSASLYRTGTMTVPHDAFTEETTVTASVTAADYGGNTGQGTLAFRVKPSADRNAPTAEWLTPWEGGLWPAGYVSTVSPGQGVALLLRVAVHDTMDDGAGGTLPGTIAGVELRGPERDDHGAIALGAPITASVVAGSEVPGGAVYESLWRMPDDIPAGTVLPFEVRVTDTGNVATGAPAHVVARVARRVYEGVETAVLPADPMVGPTGGDAAGPVFLLDGATLAVYPDESGAPRHLSSLVIYAGGAGSTVHPSVLTAPEVTSYASTVLFYPLELRVDEELAIGAACRIDVSGRGLLGNTTSIALALPGETAAGPLAGGSHGGLGWFGSRQGGWTRGDLSSDYLALPGSCYDNVRDPRLPGSGGTGADSANGGGRGGGVVRVLADSAVVRLAGDLRADGGSAGWGGGGAGGAILVRALRIEGRGRVTADGGPAYDDDQTGSGGGGRVAFLYRETGGDVDLAAQTEARGGWFDSEWNELERFGGAGTVYLEALDPASGAASGVGRLLIGNRAGRPAAITPLPALGDGTLVDVDTAGRSLTVEAPAAHGELVNDSLVLTADGGDELGVFPVTAQERVAPAPGSERRLRLTVDATEQQLADLQSLAATSVVHAHGRARFATIEGSGAARIAAGDDVVVAPIGASDPPINDRASLTLDSEARALLRGEAPRLTFSASPPLGSDVRVGTSIALEWTVTDSLGVTSVTEGWSLASAPTTRLLVEPVLVSTGASPVLLQVGGAAPGPVRYDVTAKDIAGRSVTGAASWNVLPNQPPSATIAFAAGTPAAVLPGTVVAVTVDASDVEGLQQITLLAAGPVLVTSQSQLVSGTSAHAVFSVAIAEAAQPSEVVSVQAEVLDLFASAPTPTTTLVLGILPDDEPPAIAIALAPQSTGDVYTAGDAVTLTLTATDNVAAHDLTLTIDGQTFSSPSSPLVHAWTAPAVAATTPFVLQAQASDPAGHQTTVTRTLTVQPLVNPGAPTVGFTCPSGGAYLPVGYDALVLEATATDDIGVASVEFFRAGDSSPFATVTPPAGTSPTLMASATAPPLPAVGGQDVQFRARARDASNNYTDTTITIHVVDAVTLDPSGNNDWNALATQIGVLRTGTLTLDQPHTLAGLIVLRGASITHSPLTPDALDSVDLRLAGALYVECGGSIDASGRGYPGSLTYPGAALPGHESGGSHLGYGGLATSPRGSTFGSVYRPQEAGGGGENPDWGNPGGGVVRLDVGTEMICDGAIRADGYRGSRAGAGGSLWIKTGSASGAGVIEARGGDTDWHGSGGGGAVALEYGTTSGTVLAALRAPGGATGPKGGAGTIYLKATGSTFGDLIVDNAGADGQTTELPSLGGGTAQTGSGGATLVTDRAQPIPAYFVGHWVEVTSAGGGLKGTWRIASILNRTVMLERNAESGEATVVEGDQWHGVYRFDSVTVKGKAKLDSQDGARVGAVTVEAGAQLLWFDDTPPVIDPAKVSITAHDGAFWVMGAAGAVVDPDGIASALLRNVRTDGTTAITIASDGRFGPIGVTGVGADEVKLEATSAHQHSVTTRATVGGLPANAGAPALDANRITIIRDGGGQRHVIGSAGAVGDGEPPISLTAQCQPSGSNVSGVAGPDGAFDLVIGGVGGDHVTLNATDGHPQALSASLDLGTVPGNAAPIVDTSAITITYEPPINGEGITPAGYELYFDGNAVSDDQGPLDLVLRKLGGAEIDSRVISPGDVVVWRLTSPDITTGDMLDLTVTDRDPSEPKSTTVQLGPLPPDNYGPPAINQQQISLLPLGFGFQVAGRTGAVVDPDAPVTITLSNPTAGWSSQPITVNADGSFYSRLPGGTGEEIFIRASDSHPALPLTSGPISLGALPGGGVVVAPVALGGHTVSRLRDWQASLDGGTLVAGLRLRWNPDDPDEETVGTPLGGLTHASDCAGDNRTGSPLVLDGTDLVPWACVDGGECPIQAPGRLSVISSGTLVRGITHAGYLFLASEGNAPAFHVLLPPLVDGNTGTITAACTGAVATVALPVPSGTHVLEVLPAFAGQMAVLTDLPGAELLLIDVGNPVAPALLGAIDLEGSAAPSWGAWSGGELLLGRANGDVEIWRWGDSAPVLFARWLPVGTTALGAARAGDQLWVGLADGRLQQVDLLDPANPRLVGELQLGAPVVALADLERSLLVATETGLLHVWPRVMPPEINPDAVAWGHESNWSWARASASSLEGVDAMGVRWGAVENTSNAVSAFYEIPEEIPTPPTIHATDVLGVPSGEYTPSAWQPWGLWAATGDLEWFPTWNPIAPANCSADRGTYGNTQHDTWAAGNVPWLAAATAGTDAVEIAYYAPDAVRSRDLPARRTLPATGAVAELISFDQTLLVLDDGLGVWSLTDPANPMLASHTDLFGVDGVSAARLGSRNFALELLVAGGNPGRVQILDVADPQSPAVGVEIALPGVLGSVVDLVRTVDDTLFLLTDGGGTARLYRFDIADTVAPVLLAQAVLPPGSPAVALDVGFSGGEAPRPTFVAVVRAGWGVEAYAAGDLALIHSLALPGSAHDVRFVPETSGDPARVIVTAGFGYGLISITGLPDQPRVNEVQSIGDLRRFAQRGEWMSTSWSLPPSSTVEVLSPGGFVVQPLPQRRTGS